MMYKWHIILIRSGVNTVRVVASHKFTHKQYTAVIVYIIDYSYIEQ